MDGGATWTPLGMGARVGTTANWSLTGLSLPTSGQIRARGRMPCGNGNSSSGLLEQVASFSFLPIVTLTAPSAITVASATLNGTVNSNSSATTAYFEYGTDTTYGSTGNITLSPNDGSTAQNVSANLPGLTPGTTYHYRLTANNSAGTTHSSDATFTTLTRAQSWRQQYFGSTDNTGAAADNADWDGDGISNLVEFACHLDPTVPNAPPGAAVPNGNNIEFTYPRSDAALADGVTFIVEWSDTLMLGSWSNVGVTEQILSDNGTVQQVKALVPAGSSGHRFVHLKVTSP
jgi:hypothetical protein